MKPRKIKVLFSKLRLGPEYPAGSRVKERTIRVRAPSYSASLHLENWLADEYIIVQYGIYKQPYRAGKTIRQLYEERRQLWGIPAGARAYLGNKKLNWGYVTSPGDHIEFHRKAGE